ncbi:MAG: hypothetical protein HYZ34_05925 [Ignavibacteriae bacterium]|nr:hypothetical protein [Ignavibacteriota bacterium]
MNLYTIFLPLQYNDGRIIELEKFEQVEKELVALFGGITMSSEKAPLRGIWLYKGVQYNDQIVKIEIVAENDTSTEHFFQNYKERLKDMFEQLDILITVSEVRTI